MRIFILACSVLLFVGPVRAEELRPVHHLVLFQLVANTSTEETLTMKRDGEELLSRIPGVLSVELGERARGERGEHVKDFDLGLYVKFSDVQALDQYGPHPLHQEFMKRHKGKVKSFRVIDLWGEKEP
jgi:hypothetical protein